MCRFRDGKFATITVKDGLYDNLAFHILSDTKDDSGDLWMSGNRGIYRVSLKELNNLAEGRIASVTSFAYGAADGMLSRECNGASPAGWRTRDGRLWFPTVRGVVAINQRQRDFFPTLPAYQTFVARLNQLEPTYQTVGGYLQMMLADNFEPEIDHLIDSLPMMAGFGWAQLPKPSILRGDYEVRERAQQRQTSLPLSDASIFTPSLSGRLASEDVEASVVVGLNAPALALLGIVTELAGRYSPDRLAASVGSERVGLAGWIIDRAIGSEADVDEDTAKIEISRL